MKIKNVLLIGGGGFVGGSVANQLAQRGIHVTIPTRRRDQRKALALLPTVDLIEANIHDAAVLASLMQGQNAVINLVGILQDGDTRKPFGKRFAAAHVDLPRKILAAMQQSGVRRLVHLSALSASSDAPSAYLRSKAAGESIVLAAGLQAEIDVTVLRPSVIFGPGDSFLRLFARLLRLFPILPLAGAAARFQPVYVADVAAVTIDCLDKHDSFGQIYELAGSTIYTLRDLVAYSAKLMGKTPLIIALPLSLAYVQAWLLSLLPNPLMSVDNLRSMQVDNVSDGQHDYPGWQPQSLESIAPSYLPPAPLSRQPRLRLDRYRYRAGRG
ncbi:MAG: complex I NDUFA9 subunit family protein [Pseudomonadota bacterium]